MREVGVRESTPSLSETLRAVSMLPLGRSGLHLLPGSLVQGSDA